MESNKYESHVESVHSEREALGRPFKPWTGGRFAPTLEAIAVIRSVFQEYISAGAAFTRTIEESSLERIERKLDQLRRDVATRDDLIAQTNTLLHNQEEINASLQNKLDILRRMQASNVPHKRLARFAAAFFVFFASTFLGRVLLNVTIVTDPWATIGLVVSFAFLLMAWAMSMDWSDLTTRGR